MSKCMVRMLSLFGLAILVLAGPNLAQSGATVTAEIPFAFDVGNAHLDAGNYMVDEYVSRRGILEVKSIHGSGTAFVMAGQFEDNPGSSGKSRLVFNKYGDQYFLSQVWMEDGTLGCKLAASKREKEVMNTATAGNKAHEVVQVAAR